MHRFIGIPAIAAVFVAWGLYTAGAGLLIERYLPDRSAPVLYAAANERPTKQQNCVPYPPYPDTVICQRRWMWHKQPGAWGLMGDLSLPHKSIPPLVPVDKRVGENPKTEVQQGDKPRPILAAAIQRFAGTDVRLYCGTPGYGAADPFSGEIWINSQFCNPLEQLYGGVYERPWRQGVGLLTLAHEALHIRGILNEARTECVAVQNADNLARMWRVSSWWQGVILREAYEDSRRLRQKGLYHSSKCREDGPWDQTPYDGVWP